MTGHGQGWAEICHVEVFKLLYLVTRLVVSAARH